jgi:hypothetical protein
MKANPNSVMATNSAAEATYDGTFDATELSNDMNELEFLQAALVSCAAATRHA